MDNSHKENKFLLDIAKRDNNLSKFDKKLLETLYALKEKFQGKENENGSFQASLRTLVKESRLANKTVLKSIHSLERAGIVHRFLDGERGTSRFLLTSVFNNENIDGPSSSKEVDDKDYNTVNHSKNLPVSSVLNSMGSQLNGNYSNTEKEDGYEVGSLKNLFNYSSEESLGQVLLADDTSTTKESLNNNLNTRMIENTSAKTNEERSQWNENVTRVINGLKEYIGKVSNMEDSQGTLMQLTKDNEYIKKYETVSAWIEKHRENFSKRQYQYLNELNERYIQTIKRKKKYVQNFLNGKLLKDKGQKEEITLLSTLNKENGSDYSYAKWFEIFYNTIFDKENYEFPIREKYVGWSRTLASENPDTMERIEQLKLVEDTDNKIRQEKSEQNQDNEEYESIKTDHRWEEAVQNYLLPVLNRRTKEITARRFIYLAEGWLNDEKLCVPNQNYWRNLLSKAKEMVERGDYDQRRKVAVYTGTKKLFPDYKYS